MTSIGSASSPARAAGRGAPDARRLRTADDQLEQLRFLHEVARLATTARTWDELLETVVDRTRDVLHADVSSLYLLDRDGAYLTLAATNGLDRFQIGRARVPFGEGVTGRVAAERQPLVIPDVKADARFLWVRGIDQRRFVASMLSVPLTWHDQTVGVLNVQTERTARLQRPRRRAARGGRGPARRDHREGPPAVRGRGAGRGAQGDRRGPQRADRAGHPRAADAAGDRPRLCRPARRRAAAARPRIARRRAPRDPRRRGIGRRSSRSSGWTAWSTRSWRRCGSSRRARRASRRSISRRSSTRSSPRSSRSSSTTRSRSSRASRSRPLADPPRLRQILEHLVENAVKYAPPDSAIRIDWSLNEGVVQLGVSDEGPGIPDEWRERIFEPYARRDTHTARGSGIGLYAAKRLGESMGARLWCEPARPHGARFVVALPAAVAI